MSKQRKGASPLCPWCRRPADMCGTFRPVGLPVERSPDCRYWQAEIAVAAELTELAERIGLLERAAWEARAEKGARR